MIKCDVCRSTEVIKQWNVNGHDIFRCRSCRLVFADVSQADIVEAYEKDYYKNVYPDYEDDKGIHYKNSHEVLKDIEAHFKPGILLEIGSAFGFFLQAASERGWKAFGYETSSYAAAIARETYRCDVNNIDFLTDGQELNPDVVCMFDTIEHLLHPSLYIEKAARILKKGGGLVISTGDIASLLGRISGKRWRMITPPLHVYFYSRQTLSKLLETYGFKVVSIKSVYKYQNLNSIFRFLFNVDKSAIPKLPLKIGLGDVIQVIATKV